MKICFIDAGIFIEKQSLLAPLEGKADIAVYHGIPESVDDVVKRASDAEVIAFGMMQFTNEMIDQLPNLKMLQFIGTGVWNFVDVDYATSKGIKVLNIDGYGSNAVAEFAIGMTFGLAKKLIPADDILKNKQWSINGLKGMEVSGSIFGVVGTGSIGRLVAMKAHALGSKVIACDLYENAELKNAYGIEYVSMEELFTRADIVSVHMKATPENQGIINKDLFSKMKKEALFVNVARAELVNNNDLYTALNNDQISGAAVDVYESEPPGLQEYKLANLKNVIATPHIAYYTQEANDNSIVMSVESIINNL